MITIAMANQKGGACKTTTAASAGAVLARKGKRVLEVDLDPQGNLADAFGAEIEEGDPTLYNCLLDEADPKDAIKRIDYGADGSIDLLPAQLDLAAIEIQLMQRPNPDNRLKVLLEPLADDYDYCILDCPPSLDLKVRMALTAADYVVVPVKPSKFHMAGLMQLNDIIEMIKRYSNPNLKILGVLVVLYHPNYTISQAYVGVAEKAAEMLGCEVFGTKIREATDAEWAASAGVPITEYNPSSKPAQDYAAFTDEMLAAMGGAR